MSLSRERDILIFLALISIIVTLLSLAACSGSSGPGGPGSGESPTPTGQPSKPDNLEPPSSGSGSSPSSAIPRAVEAARQALGRQLGVSYAEIELVSYERVDWPDSCLGIYRPGYACAQVITPGYKAVFRAQGKIYVMHTDLAGGRAEME